MNRTKLTIVVNAGIVLLMLAGSSFAVRNFGGSWTWGDGNWDANWANQFDYVAIDGVLTPNNTALLVGFNAPAGVQDAVLERHFTRAAGDTNTYDLKLLQRGIGYPTQNHTHYVAVNMDDSGWTVLAEEVMDLPYGAWEELSGRILVPPSVSSVKIRYGVEDIGDGSSSMTYGGSRITYTHYVWAPIHEEAVDEGAFTDDLSTLNYIYDMSQIEYATPGYHPRTIFLTNKTFGLWRTGNEASFTYRFDRPAGSGNENLIATVEFYVYSEVLTETDYIAAWYSNDGENFTKLHAPDLPEGYFRQVLAEVNMAPDEDSLYLKFGGPTTTGGVAWLGYIDAVSVSFEARMPPLPDADFNEDGVVDITDLAIMSSSWCHQVIHP
ncbi:MAG: hypothetical protein JW936_01825 [Sedimentisphaerales bacterium]|nr:hypothetical protein [Sedimentisphaerales bacterium]